MRSKTLTVIAITALLFLLTGAAAATTGQTNSQSASETVEGAFVPATPEMKSQYEPVQEELSTVLGLEPRTNISVLRTADRQQYIVFSNAPTVAGHATVTGRHISADRAGTEYGVIFADSVSLERSGPSVSLETLREAPGAYAGEVVSVDATISLTSIELETEAGARRPYQLGYLTDTPVEPPAAFTNPTVGALTGTINTSNNTLGGNYQNSLAAALNPGTIPDNVSLVVGVNDGMWSHGYATSQILVVPSAGSPTLLVLDTEMAATETTPSDASNYNGQVVSVSGDYVGAQLSTKRTLVDSLRCAPDSITNPITGCFPLVTDTTVHVGVVAGDDISNPLPVVGLSNAQVDGIARPQQGSYEIRGRVVSSDAVSFNTSAPAVLIAYQMERTGELGLSSAAQSTIGDRADELESKVSDTLVQQAQEDPETWNRHQQSSDTPPATTTQPTQTPTSTQQTQRTASRETTVPTTETVVSSTNQERSNNDRLAALATDIRDNTFGYVLLLGAITLSVSGIVLELLRNIKRTRTDDVSSSYVMSYTLLIWSLPVYFFAGVTLDSLAFIALGAGGVVLTTVLYLLAQIYTAL